MSHQVETMAYAGEVPWHGLGVPVSNDLTTEQMLDKAGLNWNVLEVPSYARVDGVEVPTGMKSLVRDYDKRVLTNIGPNWHPIQNQEAMDFFSEYVQAGDMEMHTAGSLNDGRMIWVLAKIKATFRVFGEDIIEPFLLFSNPHQYGKSYDVRFTAVRAVCNNTLTMALNGEASRSVKMSHRTAFDPNLVKATLDIATDKMEKYQEMAAFLGSVPASLEDMIEFYNTVFPNTTRKEENKKVVTKIEDLSRNGQLAHSILETQPGAEFAPGSFWQVLNSMTYVTDHIQGHNANNRLHSQWFGTNQNLKVKAAEKAVELARLAA